MSSQGTTALWTAIHAGRRALLDDLTGIDPTGWHHPTSCSEWDVQDVVAHLTAAASTGRTRWIRSMVGAGFRPDVHNARRLREHRGDSPAETLARFAAVVDSTVAPTRDLPAYLGEVLVHAEDVRRALGIQRRPSPSDCEPVARFFATRDFAVPSRSRVTGVHLRATDSDFAHGDGPEAAGPTLALIMVMAGRPAYLDELHGPGSTILAERLADTRPRRDGRRGTTIWPLVHAEREALIADLAATTPDAWERPSSAAGWSVHDVVAHLVDNARTTTPRLLRTMAAARLDFDRQNDLGIAAEKCADPVATLQRLRRVAGRRSGPPAPLASRLVEEIAHGEDIRRGLGLRRVYPDEALRLALRYQAGTPDALGGARSLCRRVTLVADGGALHLGSGPEIRGPLLELLMLATGRQPAPGSLSGPGLELARTVGQRSVSVTR